jgi:sugar O-acyltransferase (sialic acid O-acetyltransferase NeuD family)
MKQQLLIFPFNGNALEAFDCLNDEFDLVGFIDDTPEKQGVTDFGVKVFGRQNMSDFPNAKVLAVPGGPKSFHMREKIIADLGLTDGKFATLIHRGASISPLAKIGKNVLIMAGVVITSNAIIEDHVVILPNTVIHHDVKIEQHTLIGSNVSIAGGTHVGKNCYIGSGTKIINGISIGNRVLIGLGSNVIRSIPSDVRVAGNPARLL